ncbi:unnamed protein product, partial [Closterium sp. NIES-65]
MASRGRSWLGVHEFNADVRGEPAHCADWGTPHRTCPSSIHHTPSASPFSSPPFILLSPRWLPVAPGWACTSSTVPFEDVLCCAAQEHNAHARAMASRRSMVISEEPQPPMASRRSWLDVHEFNGDFRGGPARFRVTSVIGHVLSIDFPPSYQSWDATDPASLFTAPTVKTESNPK